MRPNVRRYASDSQVEHEAAKMGHAASKALEAVFLELSHEAKRLRSLLAYLHAKRLSR